MQLARSQRQAAARRPQQCIHAPIRPNYATALRSEAGEPVSWVDSSLADFILGHGGAVSGVELFYERLADGSVSRTLRATRDLEHGDVLVRVPPACQVLCGAADVEPALRRLFERAPRAARRERADGGDDGAGAGASSSSSSANGAAWQFRMGLRLVQQRLASTTSSLAPYIAHLPGVAAGVARPPVPMLWDEAQLLELQHGALMQDARAQAHFLDAFAAEEGLVGGGDDAFDGAAVSRDLLGWGVSLAMSRSFGFMSATSTTIGHVMAPLIDMADHDGAAPRAEVARAPFSSGGDAVEMRAAAPIKAGDAVTLRYGRHSNADLLLSYGFCVPHPGNANFDRYEFDFDLDWVVAAIEQFVGAGGEGGAEGGGGGAGASSSGGRQQRATDMLRSWQVAALAELGLAAAPGSASGAAPPPPTRVSLGGSPPVSAALLAAVRVVLSPDRKAVKQALARGTLGEWLAPLDLAHEALVCKALVGLATVLYKALPTSIQEDKRVLLREEEAGARGGDDEQRRQRALLAVRYRLGCKQLLEAAAMQLMLRLKETATAAAAATK